jgi:hypothetical protein
VASQTFFAVSQTFFAASQTFFAASQLFFAASQLFFAASQLFFAASQLFFAASQLFFAASQLFFAAPQLFFAASQLFFEASQLFFAASQLSLRHRNFLCGIATFFAASHLSLRHRIFFCGIANRFWWFLLERRVNVTKMVSWHGSQSPAARVPGTAPDPRDRRAGPFGFAQGRRPRSQGGVPRRRRWGSATFPDATKRPISRASFAGTIRRAGSHGRRGTPGARPLFFV